MRCRICLASLLLLAIVALPARSAMAQVDEVKSWVEYQFNDQITFYTRFYSPSKIETAIVFFQAHNDTHTGVGLGTVKKLAGDLYDVSYTHKLEDYRLRAFSQVDYRWEITTATDGKQQLAPKTFDYIDNRYGWNSLEEEPFRVYWFDATGNIQFAASVIDAAQAGYHAIENLLPVTIPNNSLAIYVYPDAESMQQALKPSSENWVAGHADADLGVIVATLPPGPDQKLLTDQRIPHELMHVLLYQYTEPGYANLPTWLTEGLASLVEQYPNSDYPILLEDAVKRNALISMGNLCDTFPRDASSALLSYAQAASFTKYLHSTYGATGLVDLLKSYANGLDCQRGAEKALGKSLSQLERGWRSDVLAIDTTQAAFNNLLPWLIILAAVLAVPLIIALRRLRVRPDRKPADQRTG